MPLRDTGVPFAFVDRGVRNDLRYFYAVTAFDINSIQSGPSSLESPRRTKPVTPVSPASNWSVTGLSQVTLARPRLSRWTRRARFRPSTRETGRFSGPFPPANAFAFGLAELVQTLRARFALRLGLAHAGQSPARLGLRAWRGRAGRAGHLVLWRHGRRRDTARFQVPVAQDQSRRSARRDFSYVDAVPVDEASGRAGSAGGPDSSCGAGSISQLPGNYYTQLLGAWLPQRGSQGSLRSGPPAANTTGPAGSRALAPAQRDQGRSAVHRIRPTRPRPVRWPTSTTPASLPG